MKKQTRTISVEPSERLSLEDALQTHPLMEWISKNGKALLYTLLTAFGLLFFISFWLTRDSAEAASDYFNASRYFQQFENNSLTAQAPEEDFNRLNALLTKHPDLHAKYDAVIAQTFLNRDQFSYAKPFAESTLQRIGKDSIAKYTEFAQITLLIAQEHLQDALTRSQELKQQLLLDKQKQPSTGDDFLFATNLVRIAFLQQALGLFSEETKSWKEWALYSGMQNDALDFDAKAFSLAAALFNDGDISLADYIAMRLKTLSK